MPTENEFFNTLLMGCAVVSGGIGIFYHYYGSNFFRWTRVAYMAVTLACLYAIVVMLSQFTERGMDIRIYTPSYMTLLFSITLVRLSHLLETYRDQSVQIVITGRKMTIKSNVTLPAPKEPENDE